MFKDVLKLFVFQLLIWKNFFTEQLPLNALTCRFENFLYITTNLVNCQIKPTTNYPHIHKYQHKYFKSWRSKEKEEMKTRLNWEKQNWGVILDHKFFTYLEINRYMILILNSRKFNVFRCFFNKQLYFGS